MSPTRAALAALALTTATATILSACSTGSSPGATSGASGEQTAESWPEPNTNIEWIVPSAAGGGNDIMARILAPVLSEELGVNVQVVNREGGNQVIGLTELAQAKPDGTKLGATNLPSILGRYLDPPTVVGKTSTCSSPLTATSWGVSRPMPPHRRTRRGRSVRELHDTMARCPPVAPAFVSQCWWRPSSSSVACSSVPSSAPTPMAGSLTNPCPPTGPCR